MEELAKNYYQNTHQASDEILDLHLKLAEKILSYEPKRVFEFGCGTGKNLKLIKDSSKKITRVTGIDVSYQNIIKCHEKFFLDDCFVGDERTLQCYARDEANYDVAFTCSVLDHIENIDDIIRDLKIIAKKAVVLAETRDIVGDFYFNHDYSKYGFERIMDYSYISSKAFAGDGASYQIWFFQK